MSKISTALVLLGFVGCSETDFDVEQYKKVIYVLSYDYHVYEYSHDLGQPESMGYLTVYCGGTKSIDKDVTVTFETDTLLFDNYNEINFDLDTSKYAKILDPKYYDIDSYEVSFKAGQVDPYVLLPIRVRPEGLSPDSTYFIPLAIQSVSEYEVNKDRMNLLYRVVPKNLYAKAKGNTTYSSRGTRQSGDALPIKIASTKPAYPIGGNVIRLAVGGESVDYSVASDIDKKCALLTINDDNTVTMTPKNPERMQVLQSGGALSNFFYVEKKVHRFKLNYRYRLLQSAPGEAPVWGSWTNVVETLKRVDSSEL